MASQRKMAVLPKCAGMFFISVIMGGSAGGNEGGKHEQTQGRNSAINIRLPSSQSGQPRVADKVEKPPKRAKLRCMNSYIIMHLQYLHIYH